jgi:HD-GYP domain-containing protein (c-di-GMP phosphodiesterase class II)
MQLGEEPLTSTVCAALTMNISMLRLQDSLHRQSGRLTDAQRQVVETHPAESEALLRRRGVDDEVWLQAVRCHHEASDGRAPDATGDLSVAAELVSVADVYCARISDRTYRPGLRPSAVLKALFTTEDTKKVRSGLVGQFIKALGVFPPGTPVLLQNGEIAVVIGRGGKPMTPMVCAVLDANGMPRLSPAKRDTGQSQFAVSKVLEWSALGKRPTMESLWGKVAARPHAPAKFA